jgi:phosphatidylglycerophosphatase A
MNFTDRLDPWVLLATCGGIGFVGFAPGTFGAVVGAAVALGLGNLPTAAEIVAVVGLCLAGIPICTRAAAVLGRGKDPGAIIWDEMAAMPLVLLAVPGPARTPFAVAVAFVLFRIFDIAKPFPCRRLERLPQGLGIMADDIAAAAWAAAILAVARGAGWV